MRALPRGVVGGNRTHYRLIENQGARPVALYDIQLWRAERESNPPEPGRQPDTSPVGLPREDVAPAVLPPVDYGRPPASRTPIPPFGGLCPVLWTRGREMVRVEGLEPSSLSVRSRVSCPVERRPREIFGSGKWIRTTVFRVRAG